MHQPISRIPPAFHEVDPSSLQHLDQEEDARDVLAGQASPTERESICISQDLLIGSSQNEMDIPINHQQSSRVPVEIFLLLWEIRPLPHAKSGTVYVSDTVLQGKIIR